jgi:hypothetical protein
MNSSFHLPAINPGRSALAIMTIIPLQIDMTKEEKAMEAVVIRSSNEVKDGWDKYGKFFLENFIGSTPNALQCSCKTRKQFIFITIKKAKS